MWVNTKASSCSEMIAEFALMFPELFKMNVEAARFTLCGNRRRYRALFCIPSTTSRTLEIASILRNYPFDASALNREIEQMPMKVAKLSGYLYQNIQVDEKWCRKNNPSGRNS